MDDRHFMELAIKEAQKSLEYPKVGAVLVKNGKVVSKGCRETINNLLGLHAEELAIKQSVLDNFKSCTLYVTLEPCSYRNEDFESCCDIILRLNIPRVVIGLKDINKKNSGKSVKRLIEDGVETVICNEGFEKDLLELLGEGYILKHN
jgi:diaminohydroxyphosphoribosylaminopyrimidine deaminase/5-amino-6-(5-phosphoribosylamino)uracil reductase